MVLLAYDGIELLDLAGVQTALHEANREVPGAYRIVHAGLTGDPVRCEGGLTLMPDLALDRIDSLHTLVLPGGAGARSRDLAQCLRPALAPVIKHAERVVSVCTGAFLLAECRPDTRGPMVTHWAYMDEFKARFPKIALDEDSLYTRDGRFWSSAGVTAGIDLTLRLIEQDLGGRVAARVARHLVVFMRRSGSQQQFSEPLRLQESEDPLIDDLATLVVQRASKPLSVEDLAGRANMSSRSLFRLFRRNRWGTPADFILRVRLDLARQLIESSATSLKRIAASTGFSQYDTFRRAFERAMGISPAAYRDRFGSSRDGDAAR